MSQQQPFCVPNVPSSRWEGGGYRSESTETTESNPSIVEADSPTQADPSSQHVQVQYHAVSTKVEIDNENDHNDDDEKDQDEAKVANRHINSVFGNFAFRSLYMNTTLFIFCVFSLPLWFGHVSGDDAVLINAYILAAFSIFIIFMASGCGVTLGIGRVLRKEIPYSSIWRNVTITMHVIGALFHFVAGCQYARYYTNLGHLVGSDLSAFGGIWWTEMFYISILSCIVGIDLYKPFLNRYDHRIYLSFALYIFCAMILMCSYLSITRFIAIGVSYLFGFIVACVFVVMFIISKAITDKHVMKPRLDAITPTLNLISAVLLSISMLYCVIAYWCTRRDSPEEQVYYVGNGIFMLFIAIWMTFDMRFSLYVAAWIHSQDDI